MGSCSSTLPEEGPTTIESQQAIQIQPKQGQNESKVIPSKTPPSSSPPSLVVTPTRRTTGGIGSSDVSDTEEYESSPEDRLCSHGPIETEEETSTLKGGDDGERTSKPKLRSGYSSGASSSTLEGDEPRQSSTRNHLLEIKHSLSVGGDLCKGVVRIEVSTELHCRSVDANWGEKKRKMDF